uniref:STAT transcription factor DNA-binding domain-containing protein n=1 Tax=Plectus sambesii TaxID=2011161 RepID=A0A914WK17_9BILA
MSVLWSVALSSATKNCKAAVTAHQDFFHANQEWSCNCNQDGSLTRCVDEWLQLLVSCLQYAEPELDKLLTTEMSAWKLQLLLEQMGYADQQDDIPAYSFEDAYNDMAEVSANALELATAVQALLQRELPCMNCDWKTEALNKCQHILQRIDGQIKKQLSKALVVMEQPPNIIRQGKNFNTSVRLLSCGPLLESANYMVAVRVDSFENAGKICNSENKLENNTAQLAAEKNNSKEFNARFSKMKITTIKERSKKNDKQYGIENRSKTDEAEVKKILKKPFVLQYVVNGVLYGGIESIKIQTISELFFYITHGSQKSFATALAFWKSIPLLEAAHGDTKAYYTSSTYFDFNIDFHVSWPFFENALCIFFTKTVGPKKGFHPDQLQNIKNKLFGQKSAPENASFSILAEQNLLNAGRTTFWEWFYEAVLLIKTDPILNIWNNEDHLKEEIKQKEVYQRHVKELKSGMKEKYECIHKKKLQCDRQT